MRVLLPAVFLAFFAWSCAPGPAAAPVRPALTPPPLVKDIPTEEDLQWDAQWSALAGDATPQGAKARLKLADAAFAGKKAPSFAPWAKATDPAAVMKQGKLDAEVVERDLASDGEAVTLLARWQTLYGKPEQALAANCRAADLFPAAEALEQCSDGLLKAKKSQVEATRAICRAAELKPSEALQRKCDTLLHDKKTGYAPEVGETVCRVALTAPAYRVFTEDCLWFAEHARDKKQAAEYVKVLCPTAKDDTREGKVLLACGQAQKNAGDGAAAVKTWQRAFKGTSDRNEQFRFMELIELTSQQPTTDLKSVGSELLGLFAEWKRNRIDERRHQEDLALQKDKNAKVRAEKELQTYQQQMMDAQQKGNTKRAYELCSNRCDNLGKTCKPSPGSDFQECIRAHWECEIECRPFRPL